MGTAHDHLVAAGLRGLNVIESQKIGVGSREVDAVEAPLVGERIGAGSIDGETSDGARDAGQALWLQGDERRNLDGEPGGCAGCGSEHVADGHRVKARLLGMNAGEGQGRTGLAGERVGSVEEPLERRGRGAGPLDRKRGGAAGDDVLILRLRRDRGRHRSGGGLHDAEVGRRCVSVDLRVDKWKIIPLPEQIIAEVEGVRPVHHRVVFALRVVVGFAGPPVGVATRLAARPLEPAFHPHIVEPDKEWAQVIDSHE